MMEVALEPKENLTMIDSNFIRVALTNYSMTHNHLGTYLNGSILNPNSENKCSKFETDILTILMYIV